MGIHALPPTTIRAIGASQVLNNPTAVIKELLDNALDANATSISIEISNNTLDSIQVRDNGHGIPLEDRALVARPQCTSKINGEDDLKSIGGSSLGFRGEALASVAELSGSLTISTRIEGEQVAAALNINSHGEIDGQERASLPVGTTVKITDFIKAHPVRKQVALRNIEKTLKKIKQVLHAYAFARPHVRLSLRVLKAKTDKNNWMYAPKPGGNAEDAAFKIVGAACASQCTWSVMEDGGFMLQAFLPRADADVSKVSNIGSFFSIDSRPVSTSRGTPKQILKVFRETLKKSNARFDGVKEPFVYFEIGCPIGSYDANVEPAKNDVLFEDPDIVVQAARNLFEAVYTVAKSAALTDVDSGHSSVTQPDRAIVEDDDFTTFLEAPVPSLSVVPMAHQVLATPPERDASLDSSASEGDRSRFEALNTYRAFRTNMYGCDEEDLDMIDARPPTGRTEADFSELRQARKDIKVSNPWVLAKLNSSVTRPAGAQDNIESTSKGDSLWQATAEPPSAPERPPIDLEATGLPTPRPSSPSQPTHSFHPSDHAPDVRLAGDGRMVGSQFLPPPEVFGPRPSPTFDRSENDQLRQERRQMPIYDYASSSPAGSIPAGIPPNAIPDPGTKPRLGPRKQVQQSTINTPFTSPAKARQGVQSFMSVNPADGWGGPNPRRRLPRRGGDTAGLVTQGELGDLIEDPRPLTPPLRNRDMRDFMPPLEYIGDDSAASLIESRNYLQHKRAHSMEAARHAHQEQCSGNAVPGSGVLSSRGFIPASELAAVEAHFGTQKTNAPRLTKRRKNSEGSVLREISGNAKVPEQDGDREYEPTNNGRVRSGRRRATGGNKIPRSKSSRLTLERVPEGEGMQNVVFNVPTNIHEVSRVTGKIDEDLSLTSWNKPSTSAHGAFRATSSLRDMQELSMRLREALNNSFPDGAMVQDLDTLVRDAFRGHERVTVDVENL